MHSGLKSFRRYGYIGEMGIVERVASAFATAISADAVRGVGIFKKIFLLPLQLNCLRYDSGRVKIAALQF